MFDYLYEWLQNLSFYLILVTAVTYVLPSNTYRKYIRFFTGLVLILMILMPVCNLFGIKELEMENLYSEFEAEYEKNKSEWMTQVDEKQSEPGVEEIVIGP